MYEALTMTTHDVASRAGVRHRCRDLLAVGGVMSAHVTAPIANQAAKLPAWSAMVVDDFHSAVPAVSGNMIDLTDRWLAFFSGEGEALLPQPDTRARTLPDV
jgi:hypothetical protein